MGTSTFHGTSHDNVYVAWDFPWEILLIRLMGPLMGIPIETSAFKGTPHGTCHGIYRTSHDFIRHIPWEFHGTYRGSHGTFHYIQKYLWE